MRPVLHVFQKDVRRLWWVAGLSLVLLGTLARQDWRRSDNVAGPLEGWLNLLVPLCWTLLIGLLILEDPLVGDRQFWISRPFRRTALVAAKLLFVLLFVHAALLVADVSVLMARGFFPLHDLPRLLWKQVTVGVTISLPALALAVLVRNVAHFMVLALLTATAAAYAQGALLRDTAPFLPVDVARRGIALLVIAAAAAVIVVLQYRRSKTTVARAIGIGAAVAAMALYAWVPRRLTAEVEASLDPVLGTKLSLQFDPSPVRRMFSRPLENRIELAIPIAIAGLSDDSAARLEQLALEIVDANGATYRAVPISRYLRPDRANPVEASLDNSANRRIRAAVSVFQHLTVDRSLYESLRSGRVKVRGEAEATVYRDLPEASLPAESRQRVAGIGWCASMVSEDRFGYSNLKLECESPDAITELTPVEAVRRRDGRQWQESLGSGYTPSQYPASTWLSPVNRLQARFHLADRPELTELPGEQWMIPRVDLPSIRLVIHPQELIGRAVFHYELSDLQLSDFEVKLWRTGSPAKP